MKNFHYGWVLVLTGVAVLFACIGLGHFSLGMLLPSMGAALGLTYSRMGFISAIHHDARVIQAYFYHMQDLALLMRGEKQHPDLKCRALKMPLDYPEAI